MTVIALYIFFWVFPCRQIVVGRRFGTLYQFRLQRLGVQCVHCTPSLWRWNWYRVPKRRPTTILRRRNTQKKIYNIQITAKVWNQGLGKLSPLQSKIFAWISTVCSGLIFQKISNLQFSKAANILRKANIKPCKITCRTELDILPGTVESAVECNST